MDYFVGIDWSMVSPSVTVIDKEKVISYFLTTKKKLLGEIKLSENFSIIALEYPDYVSDVERFNKLAKIALSVLPDAILTKCAIEGYSFGSTGARTFQIGENGGVIKNLLWENGYEFIAPAPTEIKKFAFGKGNAKKDQMFEAFIQKTGLDEAYLRQTFNMQGEIKSPLADVVDSYFMAKFIQS
jgi:hypothetical protein